MIDIKALHAEFNLLKNDFDRWVWIKSHQHTGIIIYLDNDDTTGYIGDYEEYSFDLDWYVVWSDGIQHLLNAMGIKNECV